MPWLRSRSRAALRQATQDWAERWSASTGLNVRLGAHGMPVRAAADIDGGSCGAVLYPAGNRAHQFIAIDISPPDGCPDVSQTVGHEMGHAFTDEHSDSGIMATRWPTTESRFIDARSLELVCASVPCLAFAPETKEKNQ